MQDGFTGLHGKLDSLCQRFGELQTSIKAQFAAPKVDRKQILTWLDAVSTDEDYENALSARLDGTCDWILQRPEVQIWVTPDAAYDSNKVLWIHGSPGFGKTVLCARLVEHLSYTKVFPVVHFFCVNEKEAKQRPRAIIRSWLAQLVNNTEDALEVVGEFYRRKEVRRATESDLWTLFKLLNLRLGTCFFAIDGYDECIKSDIESKSTNDGRVMFLRQLMAAVKDLRCRVLLVSRNEPDIRQELSNASGESNSDLFLEYEITREDTNNDIRSFSSTMVEQEIPNKPIDLKEEIASAAALKCDGMFLWIKLMHVRLTPGKNAKQLRDIVRATPHGLDKAYERDLKRITNLDSDERERAVAILRWTLFAERPLTVQEMTEALLIRDDDTYNKFPSEDLPDAWDEYYTNDQIKRLCGSLIELRKNDVHDSIKHHTIHFVHFSVKEYLLRPDESKTSMLEFSDSASEKCYLAQLCLRYLCYENFKRRTRSTIEDLRSVADNYAFYKYASRSSRWFDNIVPMDSYPPSLTDLINRLFDPVASSWVLWSEFLETSNEPFEAYQNGCKDGYPGPQYYAAMLGLCFTLEHLRIQGVSLNAKGGRFGNALQTAVISGQTDTVKYLLHNKVDVKLGGGEYGGPIAAATAAAANHIKDAEFVLKLLIDAGANIESKSLTGYTALHYAVQYGLIVVMQLLLENGANVHAELEFGQTPLHVAGIYGHMEAVKLLFSYGSNVQHADSDGWTALHVASFNGHECVAETLLDCGADVHTSAKNRSTALHQAASEGHVDVVKVLLDHGANIHELTEAEGTALHLAAFHGHELIIRLLLKRGSNLHAVSRHGWTALHESVSRGKIDTVKLLIDQGIKVNAINRNGETALYLAIHNESEAIVKILLDREADCNVKDNDGWTPVHSAVTINNQAILHLLLKSGADTDVVSQSGWTPLLYAADRGLEMVLKELLEAGADPNLQADFRQTPLHKAIYNGSIPVIQCLLAAGADPQLVDNYGRSCLDWASSNQTIFNLLMCEGYQPPDHIVASESLHKTIVDILDKIQTLSTEEIPKYRIDQLGRCLLLINDADEASVAFEAILSLPACGGEPVHYAVCNMCNTENYIVGNRYLCRTCAEVDLCESCMRGHQAKAILPTCDGHTFLKVPRDCWNDLSNDQSLNSDEGTTKWLKRLEEKYHTSMN